jgi:hypothetical protein
MDPHPTEPAGPDRSTVVLVAVRLVVAVALLLTAPAKLGVNLLWGDSHRYGEIAQEDGRAYRDHAVEYPPITLAAIEVVAAGHEPTDPWIARDVVLLSLVADLAAAAVIGWGFGARARRTYLVLGLPVVLTGLAYLRLDLISVALAASGLALCRRKRPTAGGLLLVAGAFAKLWPAVMLPVLAVQRRWRALGVSLTAGAVGLGAWVAYGGGLDGPRQVLTFRGAKGWQIESLPGSIWRLIDPGTPVNEGGAWRIGSSPAPLRWGLVLIGVAVVVASWVRADRNRAPFGSAGLGAAAALVVSSALLSPQFLLWLLPAAAILPTDGRFDRVRHVALAAGVATAAVISVEVPIYDGDLYALVVLLVRNLLLVALVVAAWRAGRCAPVHAVGEVADVEPAPIDVAAA